MLKNNLKICAALFAAASLFMLYALARFVNTSLSRLERVENWEQKFELWQSGSYMESIIIILFFCLVFSFDAAVIFQGESRSCKTGLFIAALPIARKKLQLINGLSVFGLYSLLFIFYGGINLALCYQAIDFQNCAGIFIFMFAFGASVLSLFLLMQSIVLKPVAALGIFVGALFAPRVLLYGLDTFFALPLELLEAAAGSLVYETFSGTAAQMFLYVSYQPIAFLIRLSLAEAVALMLAVIALAFGLSLRLSSLKGFSDFSHVFVHKNIYRLAAFFCFLCCGSFFCRYAEGKGMALLIFFGCGFIGLGLFNKLLSVASGGRSY